MMRKTTNKIIRLCLVTASLFLLAGCKSQDENIIEKAGYTVELMEVESDEVNEDYQIVYINDLHIQSLTEEVLEEQEEFIANRINEFSSIGTNSEEKWESLPNIINRVKPDLVILGGDMLDCCSTRNCEIIKEGLDKLTVPYIYLRSDHDMEPYWLIDTDYVKCYERQAEVADNSGLLYFEDDEVIVVGFNFSQNDMSEEALLKAKELFGKGKPIIVATHVPFEEYDGNGLADFAFDLRGKKNFWGTRTGDKKPNVVTAEFLQMICDEDSPVIAVLGAHLHDSFETDISPKAKEHIFTPAFKGNIGLVNIH